MTDEDVPTLEELEADMLAEAGALATAGLAELEAQRSAALDRARAIFREQGLDGHVLDAAERLIAAVLDHELAEVRRQWHARLFAALPDQGPVRH